MKKPEQIFTLTFDGGGCALWGQKQEVKMKGITALLLGLVLLTAGFGDWERTYGEPSSWDLGNCVLSTDTAYWVFGRYLDSHSGNPRACALVLDEDGNLLNTFFFGPPDDFSVISDAAVFQDSLIAVCGQVGYSYNADMWTAVIRPNGTVKWEYQYGLSGYEDSATALEIFEDSIIYVAGDIDTPGSFMTLDEGVVLRFSSNGTLLEHNTFRSYTMLTIDDIKLEPFGGYVIGGRMEYASGYYAGYIASIDADGLVQWWDTLYHSSDWVRGIVESGVRNYVAVGEVGYDACAIGFDNSGLIRWMQSYSFSSSEDVAFKAATMLDGNIAVVGVTYGGPSWMDRKNLLLFKITPAGSLIAADYYGGANDDQGFGVSIDWRGNILATGYSSSFGDSDGDIYVIKTGDILDISEPDFSRPSDLLIKVTPTPFNSTVKITLPASAKLVNIYSADGKLIRSYKPNGVTISWRPNSHVGSGVYLVSVLLEDGTVLSARTVYVK